MTLARPTPSVANFKTQFFRDFLYGPGLDSVTDQDIQNALNIASSTFNPALFDTSAIGVPPNLTSEALICYNNCAAHYLVLALQAVGGLGKVGKGVFSQGEGVISSKGAGGLSISQSWPSAIADSAVLYAFTKTTYGIAYLQVLSTRLVGNVSAVIGETAGQPFIPFYTA